MNQKPKNVNALRNSNRASILECIRRGPISRIAISRQTGLTKPAVTVLTTTMVNEGIICETGLSKKKNTPGRTSILLDIVPDFAFAVGISLHRKKISISVVNLKMEQVAKAECNTCDFSDPDQAVEWCVSNITALFFNGNISFEKCVGIGISSPGTLDYKNGVILEPLGFALFHHYPIIEKMRKYFNLPIFLENNSVSLALSDFYMRAGTPHNTLFVVIQDGIGSALLQNGSVFRGSQGYAGEIGHVCIETHGKVCKCGNTGCLELYATRDALTERFNFDRYEQIMDLALTGDKKSIAILQYLTECLGRAFVSAVNLFDLDSIVLFGEYDYKADVLTKQIEEYLLHNSIIGNIHQVAVLPSKLRFKDMSIASAIPALNDFFQQNI